MPPSADFTVVYHAHVRQVYRYLLAWTGSVQDAEDLTAQTFEAALRDWHRYRGEGPVIAWLMGIARHRLIDFYRRQRPISEIDEGEAAPAPPLDDVIGQRLRLDQVRGALAALPGDQAEVIRLRLLGDLSTAETAAVMGRSPDAVKMLLHRALRSLRAQLVEE
ncbi:MAG TPA: RNA polymerase sigma factor [Aggregatilineales bacterium]|nr:RNA polymerase sigma factor [Aggregatilineales bacterium]